MNVPEFTMVVAVDKKHLQQFQLTWPTWKKHKPSLLKHPMVAIYDGRQVTKEDVWKVVDHPDLTTIDWNTYCAPSYGNGTDKWSAPQRVKMLSAFVHAPGLAVKTPYWLKLDTDATAVGVDDWINPEWFENNPAIIAHPWGFTRPPDQMLLLDKWVGEQWCGELAQYPPLNLVPAPGADRLSHRRIGSWCAFFDTEFVQKCSNWATATCGRGLLPVPSQDGFLWYCATRLKREVFRENMKKGKGWELWSTMSNIKQSVEKAMIND